MATTTNTESSAVPTGDPVAVNAEQKHTPTPWRVTGQAGYTGHGVSSSGKRICSINSNSALPKSERDANAALIVRAVNAHDDLVEALTRTDYALRTHPEGDNRCDSDIELARAALAKAGGAS